jgi:hypothetical protein
MRMAFDFKEKFDRSGIASLSGNIEIDRSIFLESAISTAPPTWPKNYRQHLSYLDRRKTPWGRSPTVCIQVRSMKHLPFTSTRRT